MPYRMPRLLGLCLLAVLPLLLAMGALDEDPTTIPEPPASFKATLTDLDGNAQELSGFSIAGQTYLLGRQGRGEAAVPFAKIKRIDLAQGDQGLTARLTLKDGPPVTLIVKPTTKAAGRTSYGNYTIALGEVTGIVMGN